MHDSASGVEPGRSAIDEGGWGQGVRNEGHGLLQGRERGDLDRDSEEARGKPAGAPGVPRRRGAPRHPFLEAKPLLQKAKK